ncbi:hypothetical protein BT96DRAFT_917877, partial [Gymnopus androsaceus JB14]
VDAMLMQTRSRSPESPPPVRIHSPPPPRQHDKSLCSRNCPIHSKPKSSERKPEGANANQSHVPVRPPRPPTISLSIHSKPSREEFAVPVVNDAQYYVSKAQLDGRGYMPRRV